MGSSRGARGSPRPLLVIRARRRRWREGRRTGGRRARLVVVQPLVAEEDGAVLVVAGLHAAAESDEVFVCVDHRSLGRPRGSRVVLATVQGDPAPLELFTPADLWPGQSTAHSPLPRLRPSLPRPPRKRRVGFTFKI